MNIQRTSSKTKHSLVTLLPLHGFRWEALSSPFNLNSSSFQPDHTPQMEFRLGIGFDSTSNACTIKVAVFISSDVLMELIINAVTIYRIDLSQILIQISFISWKSAVSGLKYRRMIE